MSRWLMNKVRQIADLFASLFTGLTSVEQKKKLFYLPGLGHLPHPAGINGYVHRHCASTFLERISDHDDAADRTFKRASMEYTPAGSSGGKGMRREG